MSLYETQRRTVGRIDYLFSCIGLVLIKHTLDYLVATVFFNRQWSVLNYFLPQFPASSSGDADQDTLFYLTLMVTAFPFIWLGVQLTLRRISDAGGPRWMVILFFIPVINLMLFIVLVLSPAEASEEPAENTRGMVAPLFDRVMPTSSLGSAVFAVILTTGVCLMTVMLSTEFYKRYGYGLFMGLPFGMGFICTLIYSYPERRTASQCSSVGALSLVVAVGALIAAKFEGVICLVMAAPLALPLAMMGGAAAFCIQDAYHDKPASSRRTRNEWLSMLIALPSVISLENAVQPTPPLLMVQSEIEINAPVDVIWNNVASFPDLPKEKEWIFRLGLACPMRAELDRCGPGGTRRCIFTTGEFVEPIEVWDEPRLLGFSVTSSPEPMEEWSPYEEIHPPHLHGFLNSRRGQFELIEMPNGHVKLVGTTWYEHSMWPAPYWTLWSDYIIHRVHMRVLEHIQRLSEAQAHN